MDLTEIFKSEPKIDYTSTMIFISSTIGYIHIDFVGNRVNLNGELIDGVDRVINSLTNYRWEAKPLNVKAIVELIKEINNG